MSVLIKGMAMPTNCAWCRFLQSTDPIPKRELFCGIDTTNNIHDYKPDKGCPLVPVPPHGRLIEKNAVFELIRSFPSVDRQLPVEFMKALYELPIIIEVEEEEHGRN